SNAPACASSNTALPRNFGRNTMFNSFPGVAFTTSPDGASVAGASVAGISVAGASVAGISVAGISVAGGSVAGASVVAGPHAESTNVSTTPNIISLLIIFFLLFD